MIESVDRAQEDEGDRVKKVVQQWAGASEHEEPTALTSTQTSHEGSCSSDWTIETDLVMIATLRSQSMIAEVLVRLMGNL
jgi:hypothetical protein